MTNALRSVLANRRMRGEHRSWPVIRTDLMVFVALCLVATAVCWPIFSIRPLRGDNLYVLGWAHHAPLSSLLAVDPALYPEWRPLAYATIWMESRLFQLDGVAFHFLINLLLWAATAWLVHRIVHEWSGHRPAAVLAAAWLLVDRRVTEGLGWIVERQSTMACVFGLFALLVITRARDRALTARESAVVFASLLAAVVSKEYGLAFAGVVLFAAAVRGGRLMASAAGAAVVSYIAVRALIVGSPLESALCDDMGYFSVLDQRCIDLGNGLGGVQMIYNVVASTIGTLAPGLFGKEGTVGIDYAVAALSFATLAIAAIGWRTGGPVAWMSMLLPLANGVMNFMLYRERNQVIGVCGIAIGIGLGVATLLQSRGGTSRILPVLRNAIVAFLLVIVVVRSTELRHDSSDFRDELNLGDPCEALLHDVTRDYSAEYVRIVKNHYALPDPDCRAPY